MNPKYTSWISYLQMVVPVSLYLHPVLSICSKVLPDGQAMTLAREASLDTA